MSLVSVIVAGLSLAFIWLISNCLKSFFRLSFRSISNKFRFRCKFMSVCNSEQLVILKIKENPFFRFFDSEKNNIKDKDIIVSFGDIKTTPRSAGDFNFTALRPISSREKWKEYYYLIREKHTDSYIDRLKVLIGEKKDPRVNENSGLLDRKDLRLRIKRVVNGDIKYETYKKLSRKDYKKFKRIVEKYIISH